MKRKRASWMGTTHLTAAEMLGKQKLPPAKFSTQGESLLGSTFILQEATVKVRMRRRELVC